MLRVFEAFSGYGSQSLALERLGIDHEVVAISEIDKYALKAYYALHDDNIPNLGDISKIDTNDIPDHDLFTYSFPCQDISVAGKTKGIVKGETRSGLLYECERIIEAKRPKYLLLENVKNLVGKKFKDKFNEWLEYLESLGYTNYWQVMNAKDYGVPQNRERVFVVSILGEHKPYEFPNKIPLDKCIRDILEDKVDEKYYLSDEIQKRFKITNQNKNIIGTTKPDFRTIGQRDLIYSEEGVMGSLVATDYKQPKQILEVERTPLKFLNRNGKKTDGDYAFCIDTSNTGGIKEHYTDGQFRIRKLTPKECFRLMGLNDNEIDKIQAIGLSNTQQYKMAGNSIVIDVLMAIFKNLFKEEQ
ncbi:MAG: DNA cytosine methyltransferase [Romboutsia timonensis]